MNLLFSVLSGLIFGLGLIVSGMTNPAKVLGFLDLAGTWDPSLALVMAGAIAVGLVAFTVVKKKSVSLLGLPVHLPTAKQIDRRLIAGGLTFGVGWGLAGICPGPAVVLVSAGVPQGVIFAGAMLAGMAIFELLERRKS